MAPLDIRIYGVVHEHCCPVRSYLLTRSAYGPAIPLERNRRRLDILRGVTARSLASQTFRNVTWLVLVDPADALLAERKDALESSGLPVKLGRAGLLVRDDIHDKPNGPWRRYIEWTTDVLTMRIDDDDAFAPWALETFQRKGEARRGGRRMIWVLTDGYRINSGRMNERHDPVAQFSALYSPRRDHVTVMDKNHTSIAHLGPVSVASERPSWLWLRHEATRSVHSKASNLDRDKMVPITPEVRAMFDVDWPLIESL